VHELFDGCIEVVDPGHVHRVQPLGSIQRDPRERPVYLEQHSCVLHADYGHRVYDSAASI